MTLKYKSSYIRILLIILGFLLPAQSVFCKVVVSGFPMLYREISPAQLALGGSVFLPGNHPEMIFNNPAAAKFTNDKKCGFFISGNNKGRIIENSNDFAVSALYDPSGFGDFRIAVGYRLNMLEGERWENINNIPVMSSDSNTLAFHLFSFHVSKPTYLLKDILPGSLSIGITYTHGLNIFNTVKKESRNSHDFNYGFLYDSRASTGSPETSNTPVYVGFGLNHHYEAPVNNHGRDISQIHFGSYLGFPLNQNFYSYLTTDILRTYDSDYSEYGGGIEVGINLDDTSRVGLRIGYRSYQSTFYTDISDLEQDHFSNTRIGFFVLTNITDILVQTDFAYFINDSYTPFGNVSIANNHVVLSLIIAY